MTNKEIRLKYGYPKAKQSSLDKLMDEGKTYAATTKLYTDYGYDAHYDLVGAAWLAGSEDTPSPFIAVGWRWGKANGPSHNFREERDEAGISMAQIKGFKKINSFGADANGRTKHYYIGYVLTHNQGGDDELLMVAKGKWAAKEISKSDYDKYQALPPLLGDWYYKSRLLTNDK